MNDWFKERGIGLHTSKRMHFIEEDDADHVRSRFDLAYVKTYALH